MKLGAAEKWVLQWRAIVVICQNTEKKTILGVNPSFFRAFRDKRLVEKAKKTVEI